MENKSKQLLWVKEDPNTGEQFYTGIPVKTSLEVFADKREKENNKLVTLNKEHGRILLKDTLAGRYTSVFIDGNRKSPFGSNWVYRGYIDALRENLCQYTNAICLSRTPKTGKPKELMSPNDMRDYLGISQSQFYRFFMEAKRLGVLGEITYDTGGVKRRIILMNPAYSQQSVEISWEVCNLFMNDEVFRGILKEIHYEQLNRVNREIDSFKGYFPN